MKKYLLIILILSACSTQQQPPEKQYLNHTVKYQGETLGRIAAWYTGNSNNWTIIQQEDPDLKANKIKLGNTIRIPKELVTKTEPLPKKNIKPLKSKKQIAVVEVAPDEIEVKSQREANTTEDFPFEQPTPAISNQDERVETPSYDSSDEMKF